MKNTKSKIANGEFNDWDDESQRFNIIKLVREGIPYNDFLDFFKNEPFSEKEWADYFGVSTRTLDRYINENKNFPAKQSERIIEIKRLLNFGENVFEDNDNFMAWMSMQNIAMGGIVPKKLLDTSIGINMVYDQIGRIEQGIFA
jgi:putative toxin-antitoxin system antitoxin component (TIGR02293 family)